MGMWRRRGLCSWLWQGPETSRRGPVGAPDPGHEGFCGWGQETDARSGREDQVGSGGTARGDGRERSRHSRTPLAEARLERLQKEFATSRHATPDPAPAVSNREAEIQRQGAQLAEMQAVQMIRRPQSSFVSRFAERERASKRRAGFTETIPSDPQDFERWMVVKHMELQDAIEFGDQELILAVTDLIHRCGTAQEAPFHCFQHGWDMRVFARIVTHWCNWSGCRVGEATNLGPPRPIRRVFSVTSSSDDEPLVRPSGGRFVVFRLHSPSQGGTDSLSCQVTTPSLLCHRNSSLQELRLHQPRLRHSLGKSGVRGSCTTRFAGHFRHGCRGH